MDMGFFSDIAGKSLFFVGIKGTGMSRLAVLLSASGARVTGSDVPMRFSTDADLMDARIRVLEDSFFSPLPDGIDMVIHSAAYGPKANRHLREAEERGIPTYSYPRFLGLMSKSMHTFGVAGTHGKT
ncbi:MAG: Mur ligase domain-containing protein, partial [Sphaerochaetaceae bacterium]|nr:Mur ligase domain-containing protein [Sphaerochaetaceae bacterium]